MVENSWSIDWLSVTFKQGYTELELRKMTSFGFPLKTWARDKGKFGYSQAFVHPYGHTVMSNHARPEMGVHLSYGGRALSSLAEHGITATSLLDWVLGSGGKITRIDLAIDVFGQVIDPCALAVMPRVVTSPGSARKWSSVQGHDGGATAYVGSRKSERFLRIYDKAKEQARSDLLWTRFELELKSDSARAAAKYLNAITDAERPEYIKGLIKNLFNPQDDLFQEIMTGSADPLKTVKDTTDKTYDWLVKSVARSVAKVMARRADIDVWGEFCRAVHAELTAMGYIEPPQGEGEAEAAGV